MKPSEYRTEYLTKFGAEVRRLRVEKGLSQDDLAQACGYKSRSSINKIEKGIYDLPLPKLKILAEALGIAPMYFFEIDVHSEKDVTLSPDEVSLVQSYRTLNEKGKEKTIEYVSDLSVNKKYTEKEDPSRGSA